MTSRGYAMIGLHEPKFASNVGSVLRAAHIYEVAMVAASGQRFSGDVRTNTKKAHKHMPFKSGLDDLFEVVPDNCVPVAIERVDDDSARPLHTYVHPERAFYVFGGEDRTLGDDVLERCRDVVYIPAGSHNLAAAVNVVLYDRRAKQLR